jgi:hypothetical protein
VTDLTTVSFNSTAPEVTLKSASAKEATPLLDIVASSAAIVMVFVEELIEVSIPSPPVNVSVSLARAIESVPVSAAIPSVVVIDAVDTAVN